VRRPTRVDPLAGSDVVGKAAYSWWEYPSVIIVTEPSQVDADLAAGRLACPHCGGRLRPWAHATSHRVRQLDGSTTLVRPRRARCTSCHATQVLLPGALVPRRADAAQVIGAASPGRRSPTRRRTHTSSPGSRPTGR